MAPSVPWPLLVFAKTLQDATIELSSPLLHAYNRGSKSFIVAPCIFKKNLHLNSSWMCFMHWLFCILGIFVYDGILPILLQNLGYLPTFRFNSKNYLVNQCLYIITHKRCAKHGCSLYIAVFGPCPNPGQLWQWLYRFSLLGRGHP